MHFESGDSVDDVRARVCEFPRPVDVVLFIEPRFDFDEHGNLFPAAGGADQGFDDGRISADPVEGLFDCKDVRVIRRLFEKTDDRTERFVRMMQQKTALLADDAEDIRPLRQVHRRQRRQRLIH